MNGSQVPPRFPSSQEVHVWIAKEDLSSRMVSTFSRVLTEDELKRIQKLRFLRHRLAHVFAKGMLRHILARYLDVQPSEVVFIFNSFGKPFLCPAEHWLSDLRLPYKYVGALVLEGCSPEILYVDRDPTELLTE